MGAGGGWDGGKEKQQVSNLLRKCVYLGGVFNHFGALMGAPGVADARHGLPGCG